MDTKMYILKRIFSLFSYLKIILRLFLFLKDWRVLIILMLFSNFYWIFFPNHLWLFYQSFYFLFFFLIGIIFSRQRLFFLSGLILFLFFQNQNFFSNITFDNVKNCEGISDSLEANLSKKYKTELLLSEIYFFCGKQKYYLSSAIVDVQDRYIPVYGGQRIKILNLQIFKQDKQWKLTANPNTKFFSLKQKNLKDKRGGLWQFWSDKSSYYLENEAEQFYRGIALADRSSLSKDFRNKISTLGIFHLFAISGLHIGMIYLWIHFLLSKFFHLVFFIFFKTKKTFSLFLIDFCSVVVVFCYLYFIVFPITAVRAWIMLFIWILIRHFFSWLPSIYVLFLTALIMILGQPSIIFSVSFQFSFLAVFAILVFNKWRSFTNFSMTSFYKNFIQTAFMTLFINFFTAPLSFIYFQELNLLGFVNNPFHIFFAGFIYLPFILLGFFLIPFGLEQYYFWLAQQIGDFWSWTIEKNFIWSKFALLSWNNNFSQYWWWFYGILLIIFSIGIFQKETIHWKRNLQK